MPFLRLHATKEENMKKIAIAALLATGLGALGVATTQTADARTAIVVAPYGYGYGYGFPYAPARKFLPVNAKRYIACRKRVTPGRAFSPALLFAIDNCYIDQPW
jgi:hypothetical protein